jgi:hypothetical protein
MGTGEVPDGLLAPDVFCDFTMPTSRLQAPGIEDTVALRRTGHPGLGSVPRWRSDPTPTGFVLEIEDAWDDGEHWTCRELFRADISDEGITQISVYCTGDWDAARRAEHAAAVTLGVGPNDTGRETARGAHSEASWWRAPPTMQAMAAAALQLATLQRFGGPGRRTPALLHEAYLATPSSPPAGARRPARATTRHFSVAGRGCARRRRTDPDGRAPVAVDDRAGDA